MRFLKNFLEGFVIGFTATLLTYLGIGVIATLIDKHKNPGA